MDQPQHEGVWLPLHALTGKGWNIASLPFFRASQIPPSIENPADWELRAAIYFLGAEGLKTLEIHRQKCVV
ncbi:hypothetical protein J6590_005077 [Homalodisca vitripennis]|nr:hypothetical protein J6590_005077 [Homalodisca vitripennis]